jgi:hypothetical protein
MLMRRGVALVLVLLPTLARAQDAPASAAVCDGSEVSRAERARGVGSALFYGAVVADLAAVLTIPRTPEGAKVAGAHFSVIAATSPVLVTGFVLARRSSPGESFWERIIPRLKVGETRAADVRLCLHRPDASSSSTTGERWTYVTARPSALGAGGTLRTVRLTFHDGLLADVERTEVRQYADGRRSDGSIDTTLERHRGFCAPPIPVVADPVPAPIDTSAAAAAMARAQADADAATKNAQAQAAYAACMASDSAP